MSGYTLILGEKAISSWSLRPWLLMRQAGIPFGELLVRLRQPDRSTRILAHSPSGKVPALRVEPAAGSGSAAMLVWDSLAIAEYLAEAHPDRGLWPAETRARALARCASAEMHSGFQALRAHCPMEFLTVVKEHPIPPEVAADIRRIVALWKECRREHGRGGPFLLGRFSVADAMFAPVVSRFHTYVPDLGTYGDDGTARDYVAMMWALPAMQAWGEAARKEMAEQ